MPNQQRQTERSSRRRLPAGDRRALEEVKRRLAEAFPAEEFIVHGSVARGEAAPDSDLDLLVITSRPMSHREQYAMVDVACEVNLAHGSNISLLIVDRENWERGLLAAMPLHAEVGRGADMKAGERAAVARYWIEKARENLKSARLE